eukprot:Nitzschia sp. Nitz4//scaffold264_size26629//26391//26564//NITZ4_008242-RA/size26629-exonerate_est2genome-gene-0.43-mRNA-1//1//CDS//3329544821//2957//frame0
MLGMRSRSVPVTASKKNLSKKRRNIATCIFVPIGSISHPVRVDLSMPLRLAVSKRTT